MKFCAFISRPRPLCRSWIGRRARRWAVRAPRDWGCRDGAAAAADGILYLSSVCAGSSASLGQEVRLTCNQLAGGLGPFPRARCFRKARKHCGNRALWARAKRLEVNASRSLRRRKLKARSGRKIIARGQDAQRTQPRVNVPQNNSPSPRALRSREREKVDAGRMRVVRGEIILQRGEGRGEESN